MDGFNGVVVDFHKNWFKGFVDGREVAVRRFSVDYGEFFRCLLEF